MAESKTYGLFVCGYQLNDGDMDIPSCLIFEYLDEDTDDASTGIVYIVTGSVFCGLNIGSLMLCILSMQI